MAKKTKSKRPKKTSNFTAKTNLFGHIYANKYDTDGKIFFRRNNKIVGGKKGATLTLFGICSPVLGKKKAQILSSLPYLWRRVKTRFELALGLWGRQKSWSESQL